MDRKVKFLISEIWYLRYPQACIEVCLYQARGRCNGFAGALAMCDVIQAQELYRLNQLIENAYQYGRMECGL